MVKLPIFIKIKDFSGRRALLAITLFVVVFSFSANFVFASEMKISGQEIERLKTALDIINTASNFGSLLVDGENFKIILNTLIRGGGSATDVTYGLLVLSAINEMEFMDLVLSQDYKDVARDYFNQILDERVNLRSYWKGIGFDLPRVVSGNITGPMGALTLNTFTITDKVISILSAFNVLETEKRYDGLWYYFDFRRGGDSHEEAWELAETHMGFAVNSTGFRRNTDRVKDKEELERKFADLYEKWSPYATPYGISKEYKERLASELRNTLAIAIEDNKDAFAEKEPSLLDKFLAQLEGVKNTVATLVSQVNPFKVGPVAELPETTVEIPVPEQVPAPEQEVEAIEEQPPAAEVIPPAEEPQVEPEILPEPVAEEPQPEPEPEIIPEGPKFCQMGDGGMARQYRVLISEVAWMGDQNSSDNEWIELKNIWGLSVSLSGWQLQDKDRQIKIIFGENDVIPAGGYYLLERTNDDSMPDAVANLIYTGALNNSNESLHLFDNNCQLEDEIIANPDWPAGDNFSKKTMQRFDVLTWYAGVVTAGIENSPPPAILAHPAALASTLASNKSGYLEILITETQVSPTAERFVELYNPNDAEVNLTDWYIQRKTETGDSFDSFITSTQFEGKVIQPHGYFFIARSNEDADIILGGMTLKKNNTLALKNPNRDIVDEVSTGEPSANQSYGRIWSVENQGYLDWFEIQTPTPGAQNQSLELENEIPAVVQDDFNNYENGSIIGQGGWESYINGENFIVQEEIVFEGSKALYNNSLADNVITKAGDQVSDGGQAFYIQTKDRDNWGENAEVQVRVTRGPWATGDPTWSFIAVTFEKDGDVGYSIGEGERNYFATYNDNEWVKLEIEWRSGDKTARYRVNGEAWTDWDIFWNSDYFLYFDYVGIDFDLRSGGSGGVYFDALGEISVQEDGEGEEGDEEEVGIEPLAVVFNEIAWMGTKANSDDEWLELYNNTENDIDLNGWKIKKCYEDWIEFSSSTIPAYGYFLLERTDDNTIKDISADQIYTGALNNAGATLELHDNLGNLIDYIYADAEWPAGKNSSKQTMERINSSLESDSDNWATNNGITRNGLDASDKPINGTPKAGNSVSKEFTEVLGDRIFNEDLTLTRFGGPYIWQGSLIVEQGAKLTIEPGVEIRFKHASLAQHAQLKVRGELEATGAIFTSYREDQPWDGLYFENSISTLDNVTVRYGGLLHRPSCYEFTPYTHGAVYIDGGKVIIKNSLIEKSDTFGFWLKNSTSSQIISTEFKENLGSEYNGKTAAVLIENSNPTIKDSIFQNNVIGILAENYSAPVIKNNQFIQNTTPIQITSLLTYIDDNTFQDNVDNGVLVRGFGFSGQHVEISWKKINAPYFVDAALTIPLGYTLKIKPGVEIRLKNNGQINADGNLEAIGTAQNKVVFTGASSVPGAWRYIKFSASSTDSILEDVIVRCGGFFDLWGGGRYGAVRIDGLNLVIKNSVFENNRLAIELINADFASQSRNVAIRNNEVGIYVLAGSRPNLSNVIFGIGEDANTYDILP